MIFFIKLFQVYGNRKEPETQLVILAMALGGNLISAPAPQHCPEHYFISNFMEKKCSLGNTLSKSNGNTKKKRLNWKSFRQLENLPYGYSDGLQLFRLLDPYGDILEIVATGPTRQDFAILYHPMLWILILIGFYRLNPDLKEGKNVSQN